MDNPIRNALATLLHEFEVISQDHEELTDTDVREAIHLTLNHYFVWGSDPERFPRSFGMFSSNGDHLVGEAVRRFVGEATRICSAMPVGSQRLVLIQDRGIRTASGRQYDEFMGHRDSPLPPGDLPEGLFLSSVDE